MYKQSALDALDTAKRNRKAGHIELAHEGLNRAANSYRAAVKAWMKGV
jgi:hypothetical protein